MSCYMISIAAHKLRLLMQTAVQEELRFINRNFTIIKKWQSRTYCINLVSGGSICVKERNSVQQSDDYDMTLSLYWWN